MTLAEQIKQVMDAEAKYMRCEKLWPIGAGVDKQTAMVCLDARRGMTNQAPLMASIIRQLTDIVKQQHEALEYYANMDNYCRERRGASGQNWIECDPAADGVAIEALASLKREG